MYIFKIVSLIQYDNEANGKFHLEKTEGQVFDIIHWNQGLPLSQNHKTFEVLREGP